MSAAADHREGAPTPGSPESVLSTARQHQRAIAAGEAGLLAAAVEWAAMHEPVDGAAAMWWQGGNAIPLAGDGVPDIAEYAVAEFAAAVGMTTDAGRRLIGQALELAWRLPTLWEQVQDGRAPAWRARRVADKTMALTPEAAGFVDRQVAVVAGRVSLPTLEHLVLEAKIRVEGMEREDPENPCPEVPDTRHMTIETEQVSFTGTVAVHGELDLADALHLDQALAAGAEQLKLAGSVESLDARRATALGEMSRHQLALSYDTDANGEPAGTTATTTSKPVRPVTLYLHLAEDALAAHGGAGTNPVGRCENTRSPVSTETIRAWCAHPDAVVTVKPIVDLAGHVRVDQYELPDRLKELVDHRDGHCVFPWCTMPARRCDHDHVIPYDAADPARGPTCSCNLAPLCRGHHRLKTHTPWRYRIIEPGVYSWTTPHGYRLVVDHTGTRDVTPPSGPTGPACLHAVDPIDTADPPDQ